MVLEEGSQLLGWDGGRSGAMPFPASCGHYLYFSYSPVFFLWDLPFQLLLYLILPAHLGPSHLPASHPFQQCF